MSKMILEGVLVIDWTTYNVGPYATAMLADLGADVIHIEHPEHGDVIRGLETFYGLPVQVKGRQLHFEECNRNKKSMTVALKSPKGRDILYRLVQKADVFVTNYRRKAVAKLGMDYETLRRHNPRLIYAYASGFGLKGPRKDTPSIDIIGEASSGAMLACGERGTPPVKLVAGIGDRIASVNLAYGILAALLARERFGVAQEVSTSQLGSMIMLQGVALTPSLVLKREWPRFSRTDNRNPLYSMYRCKDDRWIALGMLPETYWEPFLRAIGRPDLGEDPRFKTARDRARHCKELVSVLDNIFAERPLDEWARTLGEDPNLIFGKVCTPYELASDPQVLENEYIVEWSHPALGNIQFIGFPVKFGETPATLRTPAPELGQHTEEVLTEFCGYTWEEVTALRDEGVI